MDADLVSLLEEMEKLQASVTSLAERLEMATRALREGRMMEESLAPVMEEVRRRFSEIRQRICRLAEKENVPHAATLETATLGELRSLLEKVGQVRHQRQHECVQRDKATEVLKQVLRLRTATANEAPLIQGVLQRTRDLLREIQASPTLTEDARLLADGSHPLVALLRLVRERQSLAESEEYKLFKTVAREFGEDLIWLCDKQKLTWEPEPAVESPVEQTRPGAQPAVKTAEVADEETRPSPPKPVAGAGWQKLRIAVEAVPIANGAPPEIDLLPDRALPSAVRGKAPAGKEMGSAQAEVKQETAGTGTGSECSSKVEGAMEAADEAPAASAATGAPPVPAPAQESQAAAPPETPVRSQRAAPEAPTVAPPARGRVEQAIWQALAEGRPGAAYHLARCLNAEDLPPSLFLWLALSPLAGRDDGEAEVILGSEAVSILNLVDQVNAREDPAAEAVRMMLFCSALAPALLCPETGAASIIQNIHITGPASALWELRRPILEFTKVQVALSPGVLRAVRDRAGHERLRQRHEGECRRWLEGNRKGTLKFQRATGVLRRWLNPSSDLGEALQYVADGRLDRIGTVKEVAEKWSKNAEVERAIDRTDLELRRSASTTQPIVGEPRLSLRRHAEEAVRRMRTWLNLCGTAPDAGGGYIHEKARECAEAVIRLVEQTRQQDAWARSASGSEVPAWRAAVNVCRAFLEDLRRLFTEDDGATTSRAKHVLHGELLRFGSLKLNEDWSPADPPEAVAHALLSVSDSPDWPTIVADRCKAGDHVATARVLEYLEAVSTEPEDLTRLREMRERSLDQWRQRLREDHERIIKTVEAAAIQDVISDAARRDYLAQLESFRPEKVLDFVEAKVGIERLEGAVRQKQQERASDIRSRAQALARTLQQANIAGKVESWLNAGEFIVADEFLRVLEEGGEFPSAPEPEHLLEGFFPGFVKAADDYLEKTGLRSVAENVRAGRSCGPLKMVSVPGNQATESAEILEKWLALKESPELDNVRHVLEWLGLRNVVVRYDRERLAPHCFYSVKCDPRKDRADAVVPDFGSEADGRYAVVAVRRRLLPQELVELARRQREKTLIFFFERLGVRSRQEIAHWCRSRRQSVIVIDDILMFRLCGVRPLRWPVLMELALPFTVCEPYVTTASHVPPEMFYGRDRERREVIDPDGASFIFGGRQLGKTALLRNIEDEMHQPEKGTIVRWVDLKDRQIGTLRPIDDIWQVIAEVLEKEGVLGTPVSKQETIRERIRRWLDADSARRILLLLDEADAFLAADGQEQWRNVKGITALMADTRRRFKVVFSGLHNVQRTARDANSPLAHCGDPICIGPMIGGSEGREARALIETPLRVLGYRFDPPDLPLRILSQTNYYPSLIQLFCKELLEHVSGGADGGDGPPYCITARHIDEAFRKKRLSDAISHRLQLTLDLDPRYAAIALCIASASLESAGQNAGFTVREISSMVIDEVREKCFVAGSSPEDFRALIEELEGLGILRQIGTSGRYALRSPNILFFFGTKEAIEDKLTSLADRPQPESYAPATFRRAIDDAQQLRSPLTFQQERDLLRESNGVAVVFGSVLAMVGSVPKALSLCCEKSGRSARLYLVQDSREIRDLSDAMERIWQLAAESSGTIAVVVPPVCPWDETWILKALDFAETRRARDRFLRVIFIGDAKRAWYWSEVDMSGRYGAIEEYRCGQWAEPVVCQWADEIGIGRDRESCRRIGEVTGRWGMLLSDLAQLCHHRPHEWAQHLNAVGRSISEKAGEWAREELPQEAAPVLKTLAVLGQPVKPADLADLAESNTDLVRRVLRWAESLHFVRAAADGAWDLDPVVAKFVTA